MEPNASPDPLAKEVNTDSSDDSAIQPPSIQITRRQDKSLMMTIVHKLLKPFGGRLIKPPKDWPQGSQKLTPPSGAKKRANITERKVQDIYIYDITSHHAPRTTGKGKGGSGRRRIYYLPGGGWRMPPSGDHWCFVAELAKRLPDTTISMISYPLAPKSPAPESFPQLIGLFKSLLQASRDQNEHVVLGGDSSGGNLALALPLAALHEDGDAALLPHAIFAMSPSTDLRRTNPDIEKTEKLDPILRVPFIRMTAFDWCADWPREDFRVSPLLAKDELFLQLKARGVAINGVTGTWDILAPDAVLFRDRIAELEIKGQWLDWDRQMHVFPLAFKYKLRESKQGLDWVTKVLAES